MRVKTKVALLAALAGVVTLAAAAQAGPHFSAWAPAQKIDEIAGNDSELNTPFVDGCPIESPDGLSLYMASNRPGGVGLLDIWVARRPNRQAPWGPPENLGEPVNSAADDFCPTPIRGGGLFFVSREALPGACGLGDIYFTRYTEGGGWSEPQHLGCAPNGPNSALDEQGPSYVPASAGKPALYFSRSSGSVAGDIFVSRGVAGHDFGPAAAVAALNDPSANDIQPNVRKDGRELVFSSNRAGGFGAQDIWVATRRSVHDPWSAPVNVGTGVNTGASESRPSLSRDALTLLFGRAPAPEGMSDIYVTTRERMGRAAD
jgi:WD40-like Beta Propeller Repeat